MTRWLYGPDSMMWKVNRESILLLGGRAALLMQLAHPLVAAGVDQHSDFRKDSLRRLRRTLDVMLSIIFGMEETAAEMVRRVDAVHSHVQGEAADGRYYSARDPELAKWVFTTLVYTSVTLYEASVARLTPEESQQLYEESLVIARMFGVTDELLPGTREELMAWMNEMVDSEVVHVTPLAQELAATIIRPVRIVPSALAERSAIVTRALLPTKLRAGYGLKTGLPDKVFLGVARQLSRRGLPLTPSRVRNLPAARLAMKGALPR